MLFSVFLFSQTFLRIGCSRLNNPKTYDVFINELLEYKVKGKFLFRKAKLVALSDSTLVFSNNEEIRWSELKALRVNLNNHLIQSLGFIFIAGGVAFLPLNTLNNVIIHDETIFSAKATCVSAGLIAAGCVIKGLNRKRIRINEGTYLKVLTTNYQDLNRKDSVP